MTGKMPFLIHRLFTKQRSIIEKEYGQVLCVKRHLIYTCITEYHYCVCTLLHVLCTFEGIAKTVSAVSFKKEIWRTT